MNFRAGQKIRLVIYPGAELTVTAFYCDNHGTPTMAVLDGATEPLVIEGVRLDPDHPEPILYSVNNDLKCDVIPTSEVWNNLGNINSLQ